MSARIIDGNAAARDIRAGLATEVEKLKAAGVNPGLAVVVVGDDPASAVYVRNKEKDCAEIGVNSIKVALPADATQEQLMAEVEKLNADPEVDGIIVQLPVPKHLDEKAVIFAIDPEKDADGFHPVSIGKMVLGEETFLPCTPHGVMVLLEREGIDITGKEAVVVGRSNIVGKPISMMLLQKNATVTICHTKTADLPGHVARADVLVVAAGRPEVIKGEWIKEGAVVVDVGINRVNDKWVGDVEYETAAERASAITPVPGGVGPMTRAMLMTNTVKAAQARASRS